MTVGQLRKALEGVADEVVVLTPGSDHSYNIVYQADDTTAAYDEESRSYFEWWSEEDADPGERPVRALVIT